MILSGMEIGLKPCRLGFLIEVGLDCGWGDEGWA